MSDPTQSFTPEQLASDAVGKKELATKIQELASHSFLVEHKLKGAIKNVVKTKSKEQLIADYNELFSTKAFKKEGDEEEQGDMEKKVEKVVERTRKLSVKDEKAKEPPKYKKNILKKGNGTNCAKKGDTVGVLYTGKLPDGTVFDSNVLNVKRGKKPIPIWFKIGKGQVIKGWDECVQTMSLGEKCEVTIEPEWAYGKKGVEGKIPPNSTLIFEMVLQAIE